MANKIISELNEELWPQSDDLFVVHGSGLTKKVKLHHMMPDFYSSNTIYLNYDPVTRQFFSHLKENSVRSYHIYPLSAFEVIDSEKGIEHWLAQIYSNSLQISALSSQQFNASQFVLTNSPLWTEAYTNLVSNSAAYLSAAVVDLSFLSVSGNWNTAYNIATDYAAISANFLTSETDSQTLSFNESTKNLSISNGNVISLSSLSVGSGTDTEVRALTSNWQNTFTTVRSSSAQWASNIDTGVRNLTGNWQNTFTTVRSNSAQWASNIDTGVRDLTANWQDTFTNVQSNSAQWAGGSKFTTDLTVSLSNNKTFGRYLNGQVIPAAGKTAAEVIQMALAEPINPTVNLTSPTTISFNLTAINNVLNFNHTINTLGATVATASLEWRRGNTGSWLVLSTSVTSPGSFTHTLDDTPYNTSVFNYRYIVTDTATASTTATLNLTPAAYSQPTVSFSLSGNVTAPETTTNREKGNVSSNITSGTITRNSVNVPLVSYVAQFQVNGGSWVDIGSPTPISGGSYSIPTFNHIPTSTANSVAYRIKAIDKYQEFLSSQVYSSTSTINFKNFIFYGTSSTPPANSSQVRLLQTRIFTDGINPFDLYTGIIDTKFTVAMPNTLTITNVIDLDASNAPLTNSYVNNNNPFSVNDSAGNPVSYNVYTCGISTPYTPTEHRHRVTRA